MKSFGDFKQKKQIQAEQIGILYQQAPAPLTVVVIAAFTVAWIFWDTQSHIVLSSFFIANVVLTMFRTALVLLFFRRKSRAKHIRTWAWLFALGSFISGLLWGGLSWLILDLTSTFNVMVIMVIMLGMTAGSLGALAVFPPAYIGFSVPATSLFIARVITQGSDFLLLAALMAVFLLVHLAYAIVHCKLVSTSIRQRFDNADLLQELGEKKAIAEKASADKTRFLAAASHDLQQPNQAVGLFIESLTSMESNPDKQEILDKTRTAYHAMNALLDQLLDISKLDTGVITPKMQSFRLQPLLQAMVIEHQPMAEKKDLELRLRPTHAMVRSEPEMLHRLLGNLLSNAIRYTDQGGVLVGIRRHADQWKIQIWDTGIGIAPEHIETIFQEFTQLGNQERDRKKGLGLGLAIVKRLSAIIHAHVSVQSRLGLGSMFAVNVAAATTAHDGLIEASHSKYP